MVLRKYIDKPNSAWVKLYRYVWFRSQSNYLGVFPTPKDFRTGDLFNKPAKEENRRALIDQTVLPPGKAKNPVVKSERVVVISDLPFNWKSNNGNINDITSLRHGDGIMSHTTAHRTMIPKLII